MRHGVQRWEKQVKMARCAPQDMLSAHKFPTQGHFVLSTRLELPFNWLTFGVAFFPRAFHLCVVDSSAIIPPGPREGPPEPDRPFDLNSQRMNFNAYPAEVRSSRVPFPENEH